MPDGSPFRAGGGGVRVAVRLTPKAARNAIRGLKPAVDGGVRLDVAVTAAPDRGRANAALVALLAKSWHMPAGAIRLVSGQTDRDKVLELTGEPAALLPRLEAWLKEMGR